jgi:hypothetical protein
MPQNEHFAQDGKALINANAIGYDSIWTSDALARSPNAKQLCKLDYSP